MTPSELLADLTAAGATVTADSGGLQVEAPPGLLDATRDVIAEHRDALLALVAANDADRVADTTPAAVGVDEQVARVLALSPADRAAWRQEVIHAAVWAAAGKRDDPHLLTDLRVLRRVELAGTCLRCGALCAADGWFWCNRCQERYARATEVLP